MKFGLTQSQFEFIESEVVEPLQKSGAKVYVFGSRARGDYKPFSDLDLMVESTQRTALIGTLQEKLQESRFPFKVDLVHFSEFAEAYKNGYLKERQVWE